MNYRIRSWLKWVGIVQCEYASAYVWLWPPGEMAERRDRRLVLPPCYACSVISYVPHWGLKVAQHSNEDPKTSESRIYLLSFEKSYGMTLHLDIFLAFQFGFGLILSWLSVEVILKVAVIYIGVTPWVTEYKCWWYNWQHKWFWHLIWINSMLVKKCHRPIVFLGAYREK